jgi:hypothetical protein
VRRNCLEKTTQNIQRYYFLFLSKNIVWKNNMTPKPSRKCGLNIFPEILVSHNSLVKVHRGIFIIPFYVDLN